MRSLRIFNRRAGSVFAAAALVLSTTVPAIVSAATVTERSIALGSSVTGATSDLEVKFNTSANVQSFDVTFCDAATGTCNAPAGLAAGSVTATSGGTIGTNTVNKIQVALGSASSAVDFKGAGLVNPSSAGTIYARIAAYVAADWTGGAQDTGTVALAFTNGFSVGGTVAETLKFCASGSDVADCPSATPISLTLGDNGVLGTQAGTDGDVYTLIATNADGGAVVNLKSDAVDCGGLYRDGVSDAAHCGIGPIGGGTAAAALNDGDSLFGAKLALTQPSGGGVLAAAPNWSATDYYMPYVAGNGSGVTSVYGAPVYNTSGNPAELGGGKLSFNANISNLTPAGSYKANFSLIATGTF